MFAKKDSWAKNMLKTLPFTLKRYHCSLWHYKRLTDVAHIFGKVNKKSFLVIGEIHFVRLWEVGTLYFHWTTKWRRILQSVKHANSPTVDEERSSCLCSRRATIHRARSNLLNKNNNNTTQLHVPVQMVYHTQSSVWLGLQMQLDYFILFIFFFLPLEGDRGKALDLLTGYTRIIRDCKELEKQIVFFFVSFKNRPCVCPWTPKWKLLKTIIINFSNNHLIFFSFF